MKRKRQQDGYIFKARGMWYLRYFDTRVMGGEVKRVRIAKQLARRGEIKGNDLTKTKARELARPIMAQINQARHAPETAVSLMDFVERSLFASYGATETTIHGKGLSGHLGESSEGAKRRLVDA